LLTTPFFFVALSALLQLMVALSYIRSALRTANRWTRIRYLAAAILYLLITVALTWLLVSGQLLGIPALVEQGGLSWQRLNANLFTEHT
jgi:small-conductance mechanosensitive channel